MNDIGAAAWGEADVLQGAAGRSVTDAELDAVVGRAARSVLEQQRQRYADAIAAHEAGDASARYVRALYELTKRTGETLHNHDAVIDVMVELYSPERPGKGDRFRDAVRSGFRKDVDSTMLRARGFTTRSADGRVGLADPQLADLTTKFVPGAARDLL